MKNAITALLGVAILTVATTLWSPGSTEAAPERLIAKAANVLPIVNADDPVEVPDVDIVAPSKPVKRGRQIVLGVTGLKNKPKGLATYTYVWIVTPAVPDLFAWPDNTKASFRHRRRDRSQALRRHPRLELRLRRQRRQEPDHPDDGTDRRHRRPG
jgi:hypothetical protein